MSWDEIEDKEEPFLLDEDFPWPEKGDKLLVAEGRNRDCIAVLNWQGEDGNWYAIIEGYRSAVRILLEYIGNKRHNYNEQDKLIYPILFNFHHFLELKLKETIKTNCDLPGVQPFAKIHNLNELWGNVKRVLKELDLLASTGDRKTIRIIEGFIKEFSKDSSFAFRYPEKSGGEPYFDGRREIDIVNLKEIIEKIFNFFDGFDCALQCARENLIKYRRYRCDATTDDMSGLWE